MKEYKILFWDFDGVIKDSVEAKTLAFTSLFQPFGAKIAERVRAHHERNGGMSRFEKIPLYLSWAGEPVTADSVSVFCNRFSAAVTQAVIDSPWVPGVREYLLKKHESQIFVLVTATPQADIELILSKLEIDHCFKKVCGAPMQKTEAIRQALHRWQFTPAQALVIGDSELDWQAARENDVGFFLRRTPLNLALQQRHSGASFENLRDE